MKTHRLYELKDCAQLARAVPRTPSIAVFGTISILVALVATAVVWTALAEVDLVVRAPARVRARSAPKLSFTATSGEQIVPAIAGRIDKVRVVEGQSVKRGDVLATLEVTQLQNDRARLAAVVANAHAAKATAERMLPLSQDQFDAAQAERQAELAHASREESHGYQRTSADVALARSTLDASRSDRDRIAAMLGDGASSRAQLDEANEKLRQAEARLSAARVGGATGKTEVLRRQIELAERDFAVHREELAQQASERVAALAAAERNLANLDVELAKATLRAGLDGVVGSAAVRPGDVVQPGQALFALAPSDGVRIDAAIAASDIGLVKVAMRVRVRLDAFDWQRYGTLGGTITQISTDSDSLAIAGGQVPIYVARVELDDTTIGRDDARGQLKLGMTGTIEIVTERRHLLPILVGRLRQVLSFG